MFRQDPGLCPICDQSHCACTADSGPIVIAQLPARDAAAALDAPPRVSGPLATPDPAPAETFTTATYRGDPKKGKAAR